MVVFDQARNPNKPFKNCVQFNTPPGQDMCSINSEGMSHANEGMSHTWNPNDPSFDWSLGLLLKGSTPKTKDKRGSRYIYIIYIYIYTQNSEAHPTPKNSHSTADDSSLPGLLRINGAQLTRFCTPLGLRSNEGEGGPRLKFPGAYRF